MKLRQKLLIPVVLQPILLVAVLTIVVWSTYQSRQGIEENASLNEMITATRNARRMALDYLRQGVSSPEQERKLQENMEGLGRRLQADDASRHSSLKTEIGLACEAKRRNQVIEKEIEALTDLSKTQSDGYIQKTVAKLTTDSTRASVTDLEQKVIAGAHANTCLQWAIKRLFCHMTYDHTVKEEMLALLASANENVTQDVKNLKGTPFHSMASAALEANQKTEALVREYVAGLATLARVEARVDRELNNLATDFGNRARNSAVDVSRFVTSSFIVIGCLTGIVGILIAVINLILRHQLDRDLRNTIGEARSLSAATVQGRLQTRGNPELVTAEFRPIIEGINAVLDVLVNFIDLMPMPVLTINKDREILYMNDCGATVIGLDKRQIVGTKCFQHFKTTHCNTPQCACVRAMQEQRNVAAETTARPGQHELEISYVGSPIKDEAGKVVGALEYVTDLTDVKRAGRVSAKVADFQSRQSTLLTENLKKLSAGDFQLALEVSAGDADTAAARESFVQIAAAIKQVVETLQRLTADAKHLGQAAAGGELDVRADEGQYQGEYRQIIQGMNKTLEAFMLPIQDIGQTLQRMAQKDFSQAVEGKYPGVYGQLRDNVNLVVKNIRSAIEQINESANQFAEGARVIADSSQSLASGAQTQSASVEEMSASIEELARSVQTVKESATLADSVAREANQLADQGGKAVQKSVESMSQIRTSSDQIAEIIQVISEIASQTNLLALNAAIEAARAGEHGMGFAVVADEVRKLAERSNQAAREISSLIKESTQRVLEGTQLSDQTGESLKQIITAAEATAAKIAEIATATVQQAANAEEVAKSIQGISQVTEQTAAGSEEMASSSEELGAQATTLRELVGQFKVSAGR